MDWWNDLTDWISSDNGWRVISGAIIPFVAIVVAGIIAALIGRGATKRVVAMQERESRNAAVAAVVSAARKAAAWGSLGHDERAYADRLAEDADIRLRLLPVTGAPLAANWTQHEIADIKKNSSTFSFQAEQSLAEFRERLLEWQARPSKARKLFKSDLERWKFDSPDPDADLVTRQQEWNANQNGGARPSDTGAPAAAAAPAAERPTPTTTSLRPAPQRPGGTPSSATSAPSGSGSAITTPGGAPAAGTASAGTAPAGAAAGAGAGAAAAQAAGAGFSVNRGGSAQADPNATTPISDTTASNATTPISDANTTRAYGDGATRSYGDSTPVRPTLGSPVSPTRSAASGPNSAPFTAPGSAPRSNAGSDTDNADAVDDTRDDAHGTASAAASRPASAGSSAPSSVAAPTSADAHVNRSPEGGGGADPRTPNTTSVPTRIADAPAEPADANETSEAPYTQPISASELRRRAADDDE
ncbi:hypothetical protein EDF64_101105 [Curtobacterium flaccumfaciens]|uniref:Uncharacterized protein n=1 Tax=Curtobacterium flaccumfaciens TaxID=2035 RepID=A0A4R6DN00_9MICO|nr:hypothetical protein [Curtobacterium flaccumfaciens]TDN46247.1 hypothetical protein EDF64_101105 [Curtobacterium flaccumfaciens]